MGVAEGERGTDGREVYECQEAEGYKYTRAPVIRTSCTRCTARKALRGRWDGDAWDGDEKQSRKEDEGERISKHDGGDASSVRDGVRGGMGSDKTLRGCARRCGA